MKAGFPPLFGGVQGVLASGVILEPSLPFFPPSPSPFLQPPPFESLDDRKDPLILLEDAI